MSIFKICSDNITKDDNVDVSKIYKRDEVIIPFQETQFAINLYSPDEPGTKICHSNMLKYNLPPPLDNYLYNEPVFVEFIGGTVNTVPTVEKLFELMTEIFAHTDESLQEESEHIVYEKIEDTGEGFYEDTVPEEYFDPDELTDEDENENEDIDFSDEDEDESKIEGDSTIDVDDLGSIR